MSSTNRLRELGLFDARAPRYTSYPPANHFNDGIGPDRAAAWMRSVTRAPGCRCICTFPIARGCVVLRLPHPVGGAPAPTGR